MLMIADASPDCTADPPRSADSAPLAHHMRSSTALPLILYQLQASPITPSNSPFTHPPSPPAKPPSPAQHAALSITPTPVSPTSASHSYTKALLPLTILPWYRRPTFLLSFLLLLLLLFSLALAIGLLYPHPPTIASATLHLISVTPTNTPSSSPSTSSPSFPTLNVSLSLSLVLHNPNSYSAHHSPSTLTFHTLPPSPPTFVTLLLPPGYIASRASEPLTSNLTTLIPLTDPTTLTAYITGVSVQGGGVTAGWVDFIGGWRIPYSVTSSCSAVLRLGMQDWSIAVTQQQCHTSL